MADKQQDPLAGRTDRPGYVPDADIRDPGTGDKRRDGAFGGILIIALPVAILAVGFFMWSTYVGDTDPPVDAPEIVAEDQFVPPAD